MGNQNYQYKNPRILLINEAKAKVISCFVLIELLELNGSNLIDSDIFSIKKY